LDNEVNENQEKPMRTIKTAAKVMLTALWVLCAMACPVLMLNSSDVFDGIWGE
jgi:hypothetical protein